MDENTLVTDEAITDEASSTVETNQETAGTDRTFTQEEVNAMIAKRAEKMLRQKIGDIDVEEIRELKAQKEKAQRDELIRKQKFEEVLKQQKDQYDQEIQTLRSQLTGVKVDGAVLDAATRYGAVSPQDVAALMKNSIKLDETGNPVILDDNGDIRYDSASAEPLSVDAAVKEFLEQKPYFKAAGPSGAGSKSNDRPGRAEKLSIEELDLKNPVHREMAKEYLAKQ